MTKRRTMTEEEIRLFSPTEKIGIVATISPKDTVHISLLTSIMAKDEGELVIGEFAKGLSKEHMRTNPKTGFLIMTLSRSFWRGKALWKESKKDGPEYTAFNEKPMFRYNTYFGVNTVHYLGLEEIYGPEPLPMVKVAAASILTTFLRLFVRRGKKEEVLRPFVVKMINTLGSLSFLSYIDADGFPRIVPVIQCQASDSRTLVFSHLAYRSELSKIQDGTEVAVFSMTLGMESVLVRGVYSGAKRKGILGLCRVDIDWVYNSMPPVHGQVYPRLPYEAVTEF